MALTSPVVFPLHPIDDGTCGCGKPACTRVGKHPAVLWGELKSGDAVPMPAPGAGYGIKTGARPLGSGVIVVDTDGWEATEEWARRCDAAGVGEIETYTVQSGAEGKYHFFFQHPGFSVRVAAGAYWHNGRAKADGGQGIDIKGDGGFVVGAGSPHRSGAVYTVVSDAPIAATPAFLVEWLRAHMASKPAAADAQPHTADVQPGPEKDHRVETYRKYLEQIAPCVDGSGGDEQLWRVVQYGAYDLKLPTEDVLELIREVYDPRCVPPWGDELDERVIHKSNDAKSSSARPRQEPIPHEAASLFAPSPTKADKLAELDAALAPAASPDVDDDQPTPKRERREGIFWDDWDAPLAPPVWLVEGLIPVSTVGGFVAHGSSLKTWTALSLGASVAQGVPWLGKYATKSGRVIVLDYESGEYELRRRVRLLEGGRVVGLGAWPMPSKYVDDSDLWIELGKVPGVVLVIVDSLAAGTSPGVDENTKDAAFPLNLAARYSDATGASVVFIHHSKKDDGGDARKAVRGSTAIYAAMDWCYGFVPIEETQAFKRMQMENIKPCMGARPLPVPLELTDKGLHLFKGEQKLERDAPDHEVQGKIMLALQGGPIETKELIARKIGVRAETARLHVDALVVRGDIIKLPEVGYVLDGDEARCRRVLEQVQVSALWRSEAQLATAAHVDKSVVAAMVRDGLIVRSAEGRYLITQRDNPKNA